MASSLQMFSLSFLTSTRFAFLAYPTNCGLARLS